MRRIRYSRWRGFAAESLSAEEIATMVLRGNASRLYGLSLP